MFSALTLNMQNGQVWDDADPDGAAIDLEATAAFLREQDADVVFLQEVEQGFEGGNQVEPPPNYQWLRQALPQYDGVFAYPKPNPQELPFGLGLAILSKTPLTHFTRLDLAPAEIDFEYGGVRRRPSHRLLIGAETEKEGHTLRLLNVHLQAFFMIDASSNTHRGQRDAVEAELRRLAGPALLAGDFNCGPGETLLEQFGQAGFQTAQDVAITWRRMPFVLDHIFFNNGLRLESCQVIPTLASDHHAVRAEFLL